MKERPILPARLNAASLEAGVDEAGRGCLAGPVFAAAVILPADYAHPLLQDSKKLSERQREEMRSVIERDALAWCVATASPAEIDAINILNASILAMNRAVEGLSVRPESLVIDGNRFKPTPTTPPWQTVVKGDAKLANIAAASILAKTHRDEYMRQASEHYPAYNWATNKGYPTADHLAAVATEGPSPEHRLTFRGAGRK